uniref:DUF38 domain-containing protein n=1 Tax=Panagrolaimus davidi TaxID=227884 RepID=A0A914Q328_9BILA
MSTSYSTTSDSQKKNKKKPTKLLYYFDPTTSKRQYFSIPEKIVYYAAKNATSPTMFQKLLQTCKYFFIINPVVIVPLLKCFYGDWYACNSVGKKCFQFKDSQTLYFKVWIQHEFDSYSGNVSRIFPWIYKCDAKTVCFGSLKQCLKFEEFMYIAGNAKKLRMFSQPVKYSNGENVLLEDIVKNLPKLKSLHFSFDDDESDVTETTAYKLLEIQHFKQMSHITLSNIPETLDIGTMFDFILENKHKKIQLFYHHQISYPSKKLIRECSDMLQNESGCDSIIKFYELYVPSLYSTISSYSLSSSDGELMFPWNEENDEEWEFPWDKE